MRLKKEIADFWRKNIKHLLPDAELYLFGSRANDNAKGGDIDLMVLAERKLTWKEIGELERRFFKEFGEQKIDLLSFVFDENNNFKDIALSTGIRL